VIVLGATGAGKSTLSGRLAELLAARHLELDGLRHGPNWTPRPRKEFDAGVAAVLALPRWVVDGNYIDDVSGTLWPHADTVVWLDLPLWLILPRIVRRTVRRIRKRTQLWGGNRERWSALVGPESLLTWAVRSHRRLRAELPGRLADLERDGVHVVRLTSAAAVDRWLRSVG
jgi:adenylate kinase family enzyme